MKKTLQNKKGFTLTELIVVIAIIGILAAVLIPSLTGYIEKAKKSKFEQEARAIVTIYDAWLVEEKVTFEEYYKSITEMSNFPKELKHLTDTAATSIDTTGFKFEKDGYIATYTVSTREFTITGPTA